MIDKVVKDNVVYEKIDTVMNRSIKNDKNDGNGYVKHAPIEFVHRINIIKVQGNVLVLKVL